MKKSNTQLIFERMGLEVPKNLMNEGKSSIEDVANAADDIHDYEEAPSYQIKLDKIAECATDLHEKFKYLDNLPAWVQDKITIAEHNMVAIHDWLESKAHKNKYHQDSADSNLN